MPLTISTIPYMRTYPMIISLLIIRLIIINDNKCSCDDDDDTFTEHMTHISFVLSTILNVTLFLNFRFCFLSTSSQHSNLSYRKESNEEGVSKKMPVPQRPALV